MKIEVNIIVKKRLKSLSKKDAKLLMLNNYILNSQIIKIDKMIHKKEFKHFMKIITNKFLFLFFQETNSNVGSSSVNTANFHPAEFDNLHHKKVSLFFRLYFSSMSKLISNCKSCYFIVLVNHDMFFFIYFKSTKLTLTVFVKN